MATLFQELQFFDSNGDPLTGGKLYWYEAGTTTPKDTWIDEAETNPAPNPIVLDAAGRPPLGGIWIRGSYKLKLTNSDDVEILTLDDINEYDSRDWRGLTASIADLNSTTTTALLKSSDYTVTLDNRNKTILVDDTSGDITIYLPTASSVLATFRIFIKKVSASNNRVIVQPSGVETIDDLTTYYLADYHDIAGLQSDGSNWSLIAYKKRGQTLVAASTPTTVALVDEVETILVDATTGNITVDLAAAATVGRGYRVKIKKTDSTANTVIVTPAGAETIDGGPSLTINKSKVAYSLVCDGQNWQIESAYGLNESVDIPRGYINGYTIDQASGDPQHDIRFHHGDARDYANTTNLVTTSYLIKQLDNVWVEGTNQGGRASAVSLIADKWYHCFIIGVPGTNTETARKVDFGFDDLKTAANLLTDALPFGYTTYRYVCSVLTDGSSNITGFKMHDFGSYREVYWLDLVNDFTTTGTGNKTGTITLRVPPNYEVSAQINTVGGNLDNTNSTLVYFHIPAQTSTLPSTLVPNLQLFIRSGAFPDKERANTFNITANNRIINYYASKVTSGDQWIFYVSTMSWIPNLAV